ncbi:MAG: thiolase family protein [Lachnospiraceae bacterium]|nr:thiolase family protein [Lachnospiraceae bacterium]
MEHAYIIDGRRSYIGVENGMYKHLPAEALAAEVLVALVPEDMRQNIDEVIVGNGVGASGNIGRLTTLTAKFPQEVPAYTVDMQCGSGLEALTIATAKIQSEQADLIVAGGVDSSSTAPRRAYNQNHPDYERYGGANSFYSVAKFAPGEHDPYAMIRGAERVAVDAHMTRQELNKWVLRSHMLASKARDKNVLAPYLVGVQGTVKDAGIRDRMNERFLDKLPPLLMDGEILTAGNTCLMHDGAAFLLIASGRYVKKHNLTPLAEIVDSVTVGGNPKKSPETAILAITKLLEKSGHTWEDIAVFECNEAFAVIDELFARAYPKAVSRYNPYGGALAYGHPFGASGGIITIHACRALSETPGYAVCSIAAAGGIGHAILLQSVGDKK